jgi:hypothetical protein
MQKQTTKMKSEQKNKVESTWSTMKVKVNDQRTWSAVNMVVGLMWHR